MKKDFSQLATDESINIAKGALEKNGIKVFVVENGAEAKEKVLQMIPVRAEVMNMSSVTVDSIGLAEEINASGKYNSVRNKLMEMSRLPEGNRGSSPEAGKRLGTAPEWAVGSVHAVTEDGKVFVVSATGSQLPAYAYGSNHVIWVVGSQKIVKDFGEAGTRIFEYVLPLESERAMKVYGMPSSVNKSLIIDKEVTRGRITMIIVKEKLGF